MPLVDEILFWKTDDTLTQPRFGFSGYALSGLIESLEKRHAQDLQETLQTAKSIKLDGPQMESLLTGLKQKVSLVQGPPGKFV